MLNKVFWKKFFAYSVLALILYFLKDFHLLFLAIFIIAYLFSSLAQYIHILIWMALDKFAKKEKTKIIFLKIFSKNILITLIYIVFSLVIVLGIYNILPRIIQELIELSNTFPATPEWVKDIIGSLTEVSKLNNIIMDNMDTIMEEKNISIIYNIMDRVRGVGVFLIKAFLAVILSYLFIMDRRKLRKYLETVKLGSFHFFYVEYEMIMKKIAKWFGLLFKAQSQIAIINTLLTTVGLMIIWVFNGESYPYLLTLSLMVFLFSFVPVLWVIISTLPIALVWYGFGGVSVVIQVVILISMVHVFEGYYLNPKIVSSYMELPVSITFLILIVSEHLVWPIGLIIWVPIFYIIVDILGDTDKLIISKNKDTSFDVSEEPENNIESSSQESENIVLELKEVDGKIKKKKKKK